MARRTPSLPPEMLIDLGYYRDAAGTPFADHATALAHFKHQGQAAGLMPSPYFYTDWYVWQNPDSAKYDSALHHFAYRAGQAPIDPAPFLDSVAFLAAHPEYDTMAAALAALTDGRETSVASDLDTHLTALEAAQQRVHAAIRSTLVRHVRTDRRRLVWVQAGPRFSTTTWFRPDAPRSWDLMCNWYARTGLDLRHGETHLVQPGTKVTAIHHVLQTRPELLSAYDQVLFLDDDLEIGHADIDRLFDIAETEGFDLFQPALLPGSHCVWPDLFRKVDIGFHRTTGVEIMMPGFSRKALELSAALFGRSVSAFGLDFAVSEQIRAQGGTCAVIDAVGVGHYAEIDEAGGAYYRLMRALGINQKLELYTVMRALGGKRPEFRELAGADGSA